LQLRQRVRRGHRELRGVDTVHRERHLHRFGRFLRPGDDDRLEEVNIVPQGEVYDLFSRGQRDRLAVRFETDRADAHDDRLAAHPRARNRERVLSRRVGHDAETQLVDDDVRAGDRLPAIGSDRATDHGILRLSGLRAGHEQRQRRYSGEEQATTIVGHSDVLS